MTASVAAQPADPAIAKGVAWLQSQVQSNGSLANESNSIATAFQARTETTAALASLATAPAPLVSSVASNSDSNTDYLARSALALGAAQQNVNAIVSSIAASASSGGGWALVAGYTSDALDTAMALTALCASRGPAAAISAGSGALQAMQLPDGGFGLTSTDNLYVSLWSLRALEACVNQVQASQPAAALTTWVLAQRNTSNDFGDIQSDAMGLLALLGRTTSTTILAPLATALDSSQASDGSWNEDPYLTALAVEALAANSQLLPTPTTGAVSGTVVDNNGTPLAGATVMLAGTSSTTSTAADGTFTLSSISPGAYTLQASMVGYSAASQSVSVTAGTDLDVGNLTLSPNALYATLTGTVTNSAGTGLQNVTVSVGSQSAITNAQGAYVLDGLPPGAASITAFLYGYTTATANVTFAAGQNYVFSPTLYASTPPTTATLIGTVVDAATKAPISGASIVLGASTTTTSATGQFTLAGLTPGSFSLTVSAPNYQTLTVTGTSVGGTNNVGTLPLTLAQTTSSMSGTVTDAASNAPIAGASVAVSGTSLSASTDSTGHYSIAGISGLSFTVSVSAAGYQTRQLPVQLTAPTALTLNASLLAAAASNISFTSVTTSKTAYAPNDTLEVAIDIANAGAAAADVAIVGNILDSNGNVIFSMLGDPSGPAQDLQNSPFTVPSGGTREVDLAHPFLRQPAGSYTVDVRGYSDSGQILAETTVAFTVNAAGILGGSAQGNPPLLQAGTNTPVDFMAQLGDMGNVPIPAGNAQLTVTLQDVDPSYNASDQASLKLVGVTPLAYGPTGLTTDANGNFYTASYLNQQLVEMTPSGQASVAMNSTKFNRGARDFAMDAQGNLFYTQGNSWIGEVSTQGTTSQFALSTGMSAIGIAIDGNGNQYYAGANTLEKRDAQGNETILWQGGVSEPVGMAQNPDGSLTVSNYGDGTLVNVSATGTITPFAHGLSSPQGVARGGDGSYYVANSGTNTIVKVSPAGTLSTFATGFNGPYGVVIDSSGNLLVSDTGDSTIYRVHPDGTKVVVAQAIMNVPNAIAYGQDSSLYVAEDDGIVRRTDTQGNVTTLASGL
ncbi:MAG: carboxypeptidase regulatory-like domain-containing protein, partial [Acidobacteriota bacterium]|nr:carboxypeptidase regulatory-like domain-containing protein [Acidobacteriota bacterium]